MNEFQKEEENTSGTPLTLFPILIAHAKNPSERETNCKSV